MYIRIYLYDYYGIIYTYIHLYVYVLIYWDIIELIFQNIASL